MTAKAISNIGSAALKDLPKIKLDNPDPMLLVQAHKTVKEGTVIGDLRRLGGERRRIALVGPNGAKTFEWVSGTYSTMVREVYYKLAALYKGAMMPQGTGSTSPTRVLTTVSG